MGNPLKPNKYVIVILVVLIVVWIFTAMTVQSKIRDMQSTLNDHQKELKAKDIELNQRGFLLNQTQEKVLQLEEYTRLTNEEMEKYKSDLEKEKAEHAEKQKQLDAAKKEIEQLKANQTSLIVEPQKSASDKTLPSRGSTAGGKTLVMEATAYTAFCNGCSGVTASGHDLRANPTMKVIAVDPSIIPLGTKVHVEGYGYAIASDTGGAIKGYKIDIFMPDRTKALKFGRKNLSVKILN